jgi:hypothetical protein
MIVDGLLDRDGAGHRGAFAKYGGSGAESEPGDMPARQQRGWTYMAFSDHGVEGVEVGLLLISHLMEQFGLAAVPQYRELARVNPGRTVFARVVDADHAMDGLIGRKVAGQRDGA